MNRALERGSVSGVGAKYFTVLGVDLKITVSSIDFEVGRPDKF